MSSPYQPYSQDPSGGYGQPPYPPQGGWDLSQRGYLEGGPVGFREAIVEGFKNIVRDGRASRSAFWWFFLGATIIDLIGAGIATVAHAAAIPLIIIYLLVAIAAISVSLRRLHDSGKSAYWWLIGLIPIIGSITLIVFYCLPGTPGPNKYDV